MPVTQARTRKQLRQSVGYNLNAVYVSTASAAGTTSTVKDNSLTAGGTDEHLGKYIMFTSGANNNEAIRQVTASSVASSVTTHTFLPTVTDATANGDAYELWGWNGMGLHPNRIHEFITQAIIEATGMAFVEKESLALHGDGNTARLDIPSEFVMLRAIEVRTSVDDEDVEDCDSIWTEQVAGGVTRSADDEDKKEGDASLKLVVAASVAAGTILISEAITALDMSGYDTIEFWVKSTVAVAANDLQLLLDNTALAASPLETLNIPALTADTWTFVRLTLANPETDTAIISVALKYVTDLGACTLWLDDIKVVRHSSAVWERLDKNLWWIDRSAKDIILSSGGRSEAGYQLLKLLGYGQPTLLTADTSTADIDDQYIIAKATALALMSGAGGPSVDPDAKIQRAGFWVAQAEAAKARFPMLVDARRVE